MSEALIAPGGFSPHKIRMQGKPTGQALRCKSILRGLFVLREQSSSVLDISPRALAPVVRYVSCRRHGTLETATSATVILYRLCGMRRLLGVFRKPGAPLLTPFEKACPVLPKPRAKPRGRAEGWPAMLTPGITSSLPDALDCNHAEAQTADRKSSPASGPRHL